MAHEIDTRDIQTGVQMAWHKLTRVVDEITTDNAGILYPMTIEDTYFTAPDGTKVKANGRQIVSHDDWQPVGNVVGQDYKLISNTEIWDSIMNGLAGTKHKIVSCGTVRNRSLGFASIKVSEDFIAANRQTQGVVNVLWGHGGNRSVQVRSGFTVVVFANTLAMALGCQSDFEARVSHHRNADVLNIGRAVDSYIGVEAEFKKAMNDLQAYPVDGNTALKLIAGFEAKDATSLGDGGTTRLKNRILRINELFHYGKGNAGKTLADVLNGVTDYYSHESSGKAGGMKQFTSSEFGVGNERKSQFFRMVTNEYAADETVAAGEKALISLGL